MDGRTAPAGPITLRFAWSGCIAWLSATFNFHRSRSIIDSWAKKSYKAKLIKPVSAEANDAIESGLRAKGLRYRVYRKVPFGTRKRISRVLVSS
jgi:hypothetical protein